MAKRKPAAPPADDIQDDLADEVVDEVASEEVVDSDVDLEDYPSEISDEEVSDEEESSSARASFLERARIHGIPVDGYDDEDAALRAVAQQLRQAQQAQQYVQQMAPYQEQFAEWMRSQQAAQQTEQPKPGDWSAPEYNPAWLSQVMTDEDGRIVPNPKAGGTPEVAAKLARYIEYRNDQQEKFWSNPFQYLQGFVDTRAEERARSLVQEELSRYREEQEAQAFVAANRGWLFETDQNQVKVDQNGSPVLSAEGKLFHHFLEQGRSQGLNNAQQKAYATNMLTAFRLGQERNAAPEDKAQKKIKQLQQAAGFSPQRAGSLNRKGRNGTPEPQNEHMSLAEMLATNLKAGGVTDEDFLE